MLQLPRSDASRFNEDLCGEEVDSTLFLLDALEGWAKIVNGAAALKQEDLMARRIKG